MAEVNNQRRLAAILAADVVGYTRLVEQDTDGTVAAWKAARDEVIKPLVESKSGNIIKFTGDGFLVEFPSVQDAVNCAVAIQKDLMNNTLNFRIGIHMGDIIDDGEDIHGEGVNVAARLEGLADAGGICISGSVYEQVRNRLDQQFEGLGEQQVKNISQPVRAYKVVTSGSAAAVPLTTSTSQAPSAKPKWAIAAGIFVVAVVASGLFVWQPWVTRVEPASIDKLAFKLPEKPSIAVLPFDDLSTNKNQEFFADGITEDIITSLSKIPAMFVIARNSTFTYKGKPVKVQQVAEELGVRYVLEGSIQRADDQVRITAQLIDALSGRHLWADRFDRDFKDIFALQDDIARNVVTALEVNLTAGEQARVWRRGTENAEAYELFQRGRSTQRQNRLSKSVNTEAKEFYEKALALDPDFAAAWIGMSRIHQIDARFGFSKNPAQSLSLGMDAAQKALAIDDTLSDAHMLLANIAHIKRRYDQVIVYCEKALSRAPTDFVMAHCGRMWTQVGRSAEALELINKAMRRNPYFNSQYLFTLGNAHRMLGNYDEAIAALEAMRDLDPKSLSPLIPLAATYAQAGRMNDARAVVKDSLKRFPKYSLKLPKRVLRYKDPKEEQRIIDNLRKAGVPE